MSETNKSNDLVGVLKDIRQTGTQELSKNMGSMLASTPSKKEADQQTTTTTSLPSAGGNQIAVAQEKREKDIIEKRKD